MIQARGNERTPCGWDTCHDRHHQGPVSSPSALAIWNRRIHTAKKRSDGQKKTPSSPSRSISTCLLTPSFFDSAYNDWVVFPPIHLQRK
ncbi:hypothetical protein CEXT_379621 [Caerostris extrusa]|uniref:Uncharacterized protein n=1 Tax=Caerostris extrusa TaxID=172846 RepID=A0AAV4NS65_CAEEX|nr:hypothetical protein CEXT_379621 [Caerostris extrusa]